MEKYKLNQEKTKSLPQAAKVSRLPVSLTAALSALRHSLSILLILELQEQDLLNWGEVARL